MTVVSPASRFGFLGPLLDDPRVEEIIVLGGRRTFVVRGGSKELLPEIADLGTVRRIADQLLSGTGRRLDLASPIVSAQLADGSRVHITGPPVTRPDQLNIQIRKFVLAADRLATLEANGTLPTSASVLLGNAIRNDKTVLIAGAPGAGKTTLVNCLLNEVPPDRRVVTCEEVFEIKTDLPDMTQMQTREAGLDGDAAITLRDLVREALRQRPDRIVVGEVRGPEAPRFEGHQPGRDSVQGRRRCRMRRRPTSKPQPRGSRRSLAPVRSRHHRSQSRCQRPSHHAPNRTSHRRRLNALHKGAWHHHHRSWSTSVRSRARPVSRLRRGTTPSRAGSRTVRRRRLLESVEHKRQRAKERRRQARARAL